MNFTDLLPLQDQHTRTKAAVDAQSVMLREPRLLRPGATPIGLVQPDKRHPLGSRCTVAWLLTKSSVAITGNAWVSDEVLTSYDPVNGLTQASSTAYSNYPQFAKWAPKYPTVVAVVRFDAAVNGDYNCVILYPRYSTWTSPYYCLMLYSRYSAGNQDSFGLIVGGASSYGSTVSAASLTGNLNKWLVLAGSYDGVTARLAVGDLEKGTILSYDETAVAVGPIATGESVFRFGGRVSLVATFKDLSGSMRMAALFDAQAKEAELRSLAVDPYQFLTPA